MITTFVLTGYFTILAILCVYGAHRIAITRLYKKNREKLESPKFYFKTLPRITIQLPIFNEKFVVERLIEACAAIAYPKDCLQIQVLDDSTDETQELALAKVAKFKEEGLDIEYIHRRDRAGFKAGALEHGLLTATGEFIAIFDADFTPEPDILERTVHYFSDSKVGMVQTRWEHLNRGSNNLTQIQAIMLDAHFVIEHGGRCNSGLFFNFNGTGGIWRRASIEDAGGWQHDTLTEDLDLSYRAQLKGWRFLFLPDITCPSELPAVFKAFKTQQHRWAKGAIQVMVKLLPTILKSDIPVKNKIEAFFHLSGNLAYILMLINSTFFVIPSMMLRHGQDWWRILFIDGPLFLFASVSFIYFYLSSQQALFKTAKGKRRYIPALMALGIGLGVNNAKAAVEALLHKESAFIRTPKAGIFSEKNTHKPDYRISKTGWGYFELTLGLFYSASIVWAISSGNWASLPFLILFQNGFLYVGWHTIQNY